MSLLLVSISSALIGSASGTYALVNKQLNSYFDWLCCIFLGSSFIYTVKDSTYSFLLRVLILHPCRNGR